MIILSRHAKRRMTERAVKLEDIKQTIEMPDYLISKAEKKEAYKKMGDKTLKVVYFEEDKYIKIITLMWK